MGDDAAFQKQVAGLFIEHIPPICKNLFADCAAGNWQGMYFHAHKMKASIDFFNIEMLKEPIRQVEQLAREEGDTDQLHALVHTICEGITVCVEQLKTDFPPS